MMTATEEAAGLLQEHGSLKQFAIPWPLVILALQSLVQGLQICFPASPAKAQAFLTTPRILPWRERRRQQTIRDGVAKAWTNANGDPDHLPAMQQSVMEALDAGKLTVEFTSKLYRENPI